MRVTVRRLLCVSTRRRGLVVVMMVVLLMMLVVLVIDVRVMLVGVSGTRVGMRVRMRVISRFVARLALHEKLRRRDPGTGHAIGPHDVRRYGEAAERAANLVERHTDVDERAKDHVAGRTREAVEVKRRQT